MITITNISRLWGCTSADRLMGENMVSLPFIDNAYVTLDGEKVLDFGKHDEHTPIVDGQIIDARGGMVLPAFCDPHTHLIYAATREAEFIDRVRGLTYAEIAQRGGGILNSADRLRATSEGDLFESAKIRCQTIISTGTGAVEIKSGYGLDLKSELKMLRVAARLRDELPLAIRTTFLGAHAVPREFAGRQQEYVDHICTKMLPAVVAEGLADYVDVFCDDGFFTNEQTSQILETGAHYGVQGKIHANEMAVSGGVQVGVKHNALSVDHLECMDAAAIAALRGTATMATALPGASFFLGLPYTPLRAMVDAGLGVAIASDYNPGSSPCGNMQWMLALSVIKGGLLPAEALTAATLNAAYAMGLSQSLGSITIGKTANLIITKPSSTLDLMPYSYGENHIAKMVIRGKVVK